jgi:hypothetical protein
MSKRLQAAEDKLRKAKRSDAHTIFDTEMEVIRNFDIYTQSQEAMIEYLEQGIPKTRGNNHPRPPPKGYIQDTPQDNHKKFNYIEDYLNIIQGLKNLII